MPKRQTLADLAAEVGGYYIRPAGRYCYVRWPDDAGGFVKLESRESLDALADGHEETDRRYEARRDQ